MTRLAPILLLIALSSSPLDASNTGVRIQVFGLFAPKQFQLKAGNEQILLLSTEHTQARLEGGQTALCQWKPESVQCDTGRQQIIGPAIDISALSAAPLFELAVPGKITRLFRGRLEISTSGGVLRALVTMDLETAVASIVAAESAPRSGPEALKAQAVAARSYLLAGPRHEAFDFCDTTHCQYLRSALPDTHPAVQAAAATRGMALRYRGSILQALYSRSCAGKTRTLQEAGLQVKAYPYFSVDCDYCRRHPEKWKSEIESEKLEGMIEERSEKARLEVAREVGWKRLPSANFSQNGEGETKTLEGTGIGHGIGLCQTGTKSLAANGSDFREILSHYFPNTTLSAR